MHPISILEFSIIKPWKNRKHSPSASSELWFHIKFQCKKRVLITSKCTQNAPFWCNFSKKIPGEAPRTPTCGRGWPPSPFRRFAPQWSLRLHWSLVPPGSGGSGSAPAIRTYPLGFGIFNACDQNTVMTLVESSSDAIMDSIPLALENFATITNFICMKVVQIFSKWSNVNVYNNLSEKKIN